MKYVSYQTHDDEALQDQNEQLQQEVCLSASFHSFLHYLLYSKMEILLLAECGDWWRGMSRNVSCE